MGSNLTRMIGAMSAAIVLAGTTFAGFSTVPGGPVGHIDIPEIARLGGGLGPKFDHPLDTLGTAAFVEGAETGLTPTLARRTIELPGNGRGPDGIVTTSAVPTPGVVTLGLVGAGVLGLRRRR
jgi:MYXO-CTERM domain-containing protein